MINFIRIIIYYYHKKVFRKLEVRFKSTFGLNLDNTRYHKNR